MIFIKPEMHEMVRHLASVHGLASEKHPDDKQIHSARASALECSILCDAQDLPDQGLLIRRAFDAQ